jgi:peptidoglycan hydrolase-like protein with peptidoglycan-binding domain
MKIKFAVLFLLASAGLVGADQAIENAQQALKDQGFYYGEITGEKNADTTAAIRRYQIRNGLQVTGDLNDETIRALGVAASSASSQPVAKASPSATPDTSDLRGEAPRETVGPQNPRPGQPFPVPPQDRDVNPSNPVPVSPATRSLFAGTPYEAASPEVQQNVVVSAQTVLARRGLYRGEIDGLVGPNLEFSLRAYQSRVGLPVTGRLDLGTLAALKLLPGANAPVFPPRRRVLPPVRGEWIRE